MPRIPIPEYGRQRATQEPYAPYFRQSNQLAGLGDAIAELGDKLQKKQNTEGMLHGQKMLNEHKLAMLEQEKYVLSENERGGSALVDGYTGLYEEGDQSFLDSDQVKSLPPKVQEFVREKVQQNNYARRSSSIPIASQLSGQAARKDLDESLSSTMLFVQQTNANGQMDLGSLDNSLQAYEDVLKENHYFTNKPEAMEAEIQRARKAVTDTFFETNLNAPNVTQAHLRSLLGTLEERADSMNPKDVATHRANINRTLSQVEQAELRKVGEYVTANRDKVKQWQPPEDNSRLIESYPDGEARDVLVREEELTHRIWGYMNQPVEDVVQNSMASQAELTKIKAGQLLPESVAASPRASEIKTASVLTGMNPVFLNAVVPEGADMIMEGERLSVLIKQHNGDTRKALSVYLTGSEIAAQSGELIKDNGKLRYVTQSPQVSLEVDQVMARVGDESPFYRFIDNPDFQKAELEAQAWSTAAALQAERIKKDPRGMLTMMDKEARDAWYNYQNADEGTIAEARKNWASVVSVKAPAFGIAQHNMPMLPQQEIDFYKQSFGYGPDGNVRPAQDSIQKIHSDWGAMTPMILRQMRNEGVISEHQRVAALVTDPNAQMALLRSQGFESQLKADIKNGIQQTIATEAKQVISALTASNQGGLAQDYVKSSMYLAEHYMRSGMSQTDAVKAAINATFGEYKPGEEQGFLFMKPDHAGLMATAALKNDDPENYRIGAEVLIDNLSIEDIAAISTDPNMSSTEARKQVIGSLKDGNARIVFTEDQSKAQIFIKTKAGTYQPMVKADGNLLEFNAESLREISSMVTDEAVAMAGGDKRVTPPIMQSAKKAVWGAITMGPPEPDITQGSYDVEEFQAPIRPDSEVMPEAGKTFNAEDIITVKSSDGFINVNTIVGGRKISDNDAVALWKDGQNPEVGIAGTYDRAREMATERSTKINNEVIFPKVRNQPQKIHGVDAMYPQGKYLPKGANFQVYDNVSYNMAGVRTMRVDPQVEKALSSTFPANWNVQIYSGAQTGSGPRTGTARHDSALAADVYVRDEKGNVVTDKKLAPYIQQWVANGGNVGAFMDGGGLHLDMIEKRDIGYRAWGYGSMKRPDNLTTLQHWKTTKPWLYEAVSKGLRGETVDMPTKKVASKNVPQQVNIDSLRQAIIGKESGGRSTVVNADSGAIGLGQVIPSNVGPWTEKYFGEKLTPEQFKSNQEAQLAVINGRLNDMITRELKKYPPDIAIRRAASEWYSGRPNLYNSTKSQGKYPTIKDYTLDILSRYQASAS